MEVIEYSKDLNKAKIANIAFAPIDNKKILRIYEHSKEDNYKVGDITEDKETEKLMQGECLAELVFYHDESIDSLITAL